MKSTAIALAITIAIIIAIVLISHKACGAEIDAIRATVIVDAPDSVSDNEEFNVQIMIESASDVGGFQMDLEYDEDIIRAQEVYEGLFFAQAGSSFWLEPDIDNGDGKIRNIVCIRTGHGGVSGGALLFTVVFKARRIGTTEIRIVNEEFVDEDSRRLRVRIEDGTVRVVEYPNWDVDQDGTVDVVDLVYVGQRFGDWISGNPSPNPDVDRDGRVDLDDLLAVVNHFGEGNYAAPGVQGIITLQQRAALERIRQELLSAEDGKRALKLIESLLKPSQGICVRTWGFVKKGAL